MTALFLNKISLFLSFFFFPLIQTALISYIRPVFVSRSDQDSRRKTVKEIKRRAQTGGLWPQVMCKLKKQNLLFMCSCVHIIEEITYLNWELNRVVDSSEKQSFYSIEAALDTASNSHAHMKMMARSTINEQRNGDSTWVI